MDSMRSLNTSLPRSSRRSDPPSEPLIQAFKAAALSVTNLYKTAVTDQSQTREAGYQEALDDLLAFLDKENIGLDDGEGWRIRQWATERLDGTPLSHGSNNGEPQHEEPMKEQIESQEKIEAQEKTKARPPSRSSSPVQETSTSASNQSTHQQNTLLPTPESFSFRSGPPYPQDVDMQTTDGLNSNASQSELPAQSQVPASGAAVRVEVVPRTSRTPHRANRHNTRASAGTKSLGVGAGAKRGFRFGDYEFDLGGLGDGKDGTGGGGKRGRFT